MDFRDIDGPTRREMIGGAAALGAGAALVQPAALFAEAGSLADIRKAAEAGKEASIKRIRDWIALPSIAAEDRNMPEGAAYFAQLARDAGFSNVEVVPTDGHPGVFGTLDVGAPRTLGLYFMYDVKQYDPAEWSSPPLEGRLGEREGLGTVMLGRGSANHKGPEATFLAALHAIRAAGRKLPVNLVLICEGEEEIGSPHIHQLVTKPNVLAAFRKCDGVFMPTCLQDLEGGATIELGAKGIIELELVASGEKWGRGPKKDIHSSLKAIVDSPAWRLVQALQTLVTPDGNKPAIDGWFENVRLLTENEKKMIREGIKHTNEARMKENLGVPHWVDDLSLEDAMVRLMQDPTVNIEGLVAGYTGPGGKTILPGRAVAKLDFRLVPNQTRAEAVKKLRAHLDKRGFKDVEMNVSGGYDPTETDPNSRLIRAEIATYKKLGVRPNISVRLAGSWPGGSFTQPPVSQPVGRFGLGTGGNAHAPDEYLLIDSTNPKVAGIVDATMGYAEFLYTFASIK
ncbi:M20/M25/M40 family metallo-hydrolase [Sphingosinicella rhizophila]|uniref:M20/M25/M40 family metallo-hydrolase n=1 Tax=Sphingosinicella rhizophila TaxID=3050082 RepID=A0ABU3Q687_9SPHN|nr:M20/M25/M40 family metallo-hydrolase [Sphingosinicella sp. GR2756]MDT9598817.1 M20/M25/M40 family metallo-hydrolase [Sphingosinicella sp. GR2756]